MYSHTTESLHNIFSFVTAIKQQQKVKLYPELKREIEELLYLEQQMKKGKIAFEDSNIINFVLESVLLSFTNDKAHR